MEPKWYDGWNLDKLSKYVVVKPQVNQTEAHFMSHDNITDTYTYLPPYSPDFNPIEKFFSKLKALLRKAAKRSIDALWKEIGDLLDAVTAGECSNFFASCGYVNT